jgi:hypothetical protein
VPFFLAKEIMSHISNTVYELHKQYGSCIRYIEIESSITNRSTGSKVIKKKVYDVDVVHLPSNLLRKFVQDIGYLAANKNFTYGGLNDFDSIGFLFNDLFFNPDLNGYIIWQNKRFEKVSVDSFNNGESHLLKVKLVQGGLPYDVEPVYGGNILQIAGVASYELN